MEIDPASMTIRIRAATPMDAGPIARVHVDTWRTTYAGIVPEEHLASLSYQERESRWDRILTTDQPASSYFVTENDVGEVVGFASGGPERESNQASRGEIYAIYVLELYQGKGIGRRLVEAVAQRLQAEGFSSVLAWVLKDNRPARRFYESLGGEQVGRKKTAIGGTDHIELSYGWGDIGSLIFKRAV